LTERDDESETFSASELAEDVALDPEVAASPSAKTPFERTPAERIQESRAKLEEERAKQARQNTIWRRFLFWGVSSIVLAVTLLGGVVIVLYLTTTGLEADPLVLSTWFGSSVIQVVGLLLVITRHLFPQDSK
jgi:hypothetical protein